jgi:hypothetical protein
MAALTGQKTFLEIQTEIADECGGVTIANLVRPSLTQLKRIINDAERVICGSFDWVWLYREFTFPTVANQTTAYALDDTAAELMWLTIPAKQYKLAWMGMSTWEAAYPGRYASTGPSIPWAYIQAPPASNMGLQYFLFPQADQVYTCNYGAKLRVGSMSADGDYPVIPVDWQDMLLNKAKADYLQYLRLPGVDPRIQGYMAKYQEVWKLAWMKDQSNGEQVNRLRDAPLERNLGLGVGMDPARIMWITGGSV